MSIYKKYGKKLLYNKTKFERAVLAVGSEKKVKEVLKAYVNGGGYLEDDPDFKKKKKAKKDKKEKKSKKEALKDIFKKKK